MTQTDAYEEVPIDKEGIVEQLNGDGILYTRGVVDVGLTIKSDAYADYSVDVAVQDGNDSLRWVKGEIIYSQSDIDTTDIHDAWRQIAFALRLRVVDPAGAGETATVAISRAWGGK